MIKKKSTKNKSVFTEFRNLLINSYKLNPSYFLTPSRVKTQTFIENTIFYNGKKIYFLKIQKGI